jgi:hypothetical protein
MKHIQALLNRMHRALTRPFFWFALQINLLFELGFKRRIKNLLKKFLYRLISLVGKHPKLKQLAAYLGRKFGLVRLLQRLQSDVLFLPQTPPNNSIYLTPRANVIFLDLKDAIEKHAHKVI